MEENEMKKYYRDFYGSTASIAIRKDGTAKLTMCYAGKRESKIYKSERGAKIAMGKASDCWTEIKK